ncbi:hypothetical protein F2Q68_00001584 [Brassica cretica]|uniref:Uncharacterized protein n=1 Tax=Brassica cretica TaxID=69181 RepID=A0A8S9JBJ3_BRACR|nr:hypothetical protein F2Q68_00001584 [Brassica cretica]
MRFWSQMSYKTFKSVENGAVAGNYRREMEVAMGPQDAVAGKWRLLRRCRLLSRDKSGCGCVSTKLDRAFRRLLPQDVEVADVVRNIAFYHFTLEFLSYYKYIVNLILGVAGNYPRQMEVATGPQATVAGKWRLLRRRRLLSRDKSGCGRVSTKLDMAFRRLLPQDVEVAAVVRNIAFYHFTLEFLSNYKYIVNLI